MMLSTALHLVQKIKIKNKKTYEKKQRETEKDRVPLFCFLVNTRNLKPFAIRDLNLADSTKISPQTFKEATDAGQCPGWVGNSLL